MLRILSGKFKGRQLQSPPQSATRPTLGIVRQAVFNICQQRVAGSTFLDLFAGSGAMGLEALSKDALYAVFVEQNRAAAQCIRSNIALLHLEKETLVIPFEFGSALKQLKTLGKRFDLVYIDPPYAKGPTIPAILQELDHSGLLAHDTLLFAEDASDQKEFLYESDTMRRIDVRSFGIARLHQFEYVQAL